MPAPPSAGQQIPVPFFFFVFFVAFFVVFFAMCYLSEKAAGLMPDRARRCVRALTHQCPSKIWQRRTWSEDGGRRF
jgi:hypothetical protein